jgi:hypothetical protein
MGAFVHYLNRSAVHNIHLKAMPWVGRAFYRSGKMQTACRAEIGRRLRERYDGDARPMPKRLADLVRPMRKSESDFP